MKFIDGSYIEPRVHEERSRRLTIAERIASLPLLDSGKRRNNPSLIIEGFSDSDDVDPGAAKELAAQIYGELYGPNPDSDTVDEYRVFTDQSKIWLFGPDRTNWPSWVDTDN
jgi:hypothetical protein